MKINLYLSWNSWCIGVYWHKKYKILYIYPLPVVTIRIIMSPYYAPYDVIPFWELDE